MSIVYRIDKENGTLFIVWDGVIKAGDPQQNALGVTTDEDFPPARNLILTDLRTAIIDPSIDAEVLEEVATFYGSHEKADKLRVALVASEAYTRSDLFQQLVSQYGISAIVFNTLDTACIWLGIDEEMCERTLQELHDQARIGRQGRV